MPPATDTLPFLVCPITKRPLRREGDFLVSGTGPLQLKFPIRDNLPVLLPSAAILPPGITSIEQFKAATATPAQVAASADRPL